jgi:hypothetical protein
MATSPSPERETFHFDFDEGGWGVVSAWMADSGSRDSFLGGMEGVGEVSVIDGSCVVGFRFHGAMLRDVFRWLLQDFVLD